MLRQHDWFDLRIAGLFRGARTVHVTVSRCQPEVEVCPLVPPVTLSFRSIRLSVFDRVIDPRAKDDAIQETFEGDAAYVAAYTEERDLLFAASLVADRAEQQRMVRRAVTP